MENIKNFTKNIKKLFFHKSKRHHKNYNCPIGKFIKAEPSSFELNDKIYNLNIDEEEENKYSNDEIDQESGKASLSQSTKCYECGICCKTIENVKIALSCMCFVCSDCQKNQKYCISCNKPITSVNNSQEVQGIFNNLNYMIDNENNNDQIIIKLEELLKSTSEMYAQLSIDKKL